MTDLKYYLERRGKEAYLVCWSSVEEEILMPVNVEDQSIFDVYGESIRVAVQLYPLVKKETDE